ncbi:protein Skeletor, isoforms B/C-like [Dysidea avara]|uniref:protein Skeletor, isoforms B/C-like n=1 Tax=Dysidea avara TaxID=196820 RepID=UPI00331732AA
MYLLTEIAVILGVFFLTAQGAVEIGELPNLDHGIQGTLAAKDETTLLIKNFHYDGQAPAVYVYVYLRNATVDPSGGGILINWRESGSDGRIARRYTGQDITISLDDRPDREDSRLTVNDIGTLTIWCQRFEVFFSRIDIPKGLMLSSASPVLQYCAQLTTNFQVSWTVDADSEIGTFELCSCIDSDQYMAFGISGNDTKTFMVGADVVVAWVGQDGVANAVDYYLTSRQQCRGGSGVCPDDLITGNGGGSQDIVNITGQVSNGRTCVQYSRSLTTEDSRYDRPILANQSQFIVWAYGPRANEEGLGDLALFHTEFPRNGENIEINFGAAPQGTRQCSAPLQCSEEVQICGWTGKAIAANGPTIFRVRIGPSGGPRGYEFITGLSGWGIAYYIDNTLIPVLRVRRGVTYTFIVEAGDDVNDGPNYHPFYITNSIDGGILLDTPEQRARKNEVVYAGFDVDTNTPLAAGRHCQHVETSSSGNVATSCSNSLEDYLNTLTVSCEGDESEAAILTWTPDDNTPDLVYYQCANHFHLGWRIEVFSDTIPNTEGPEDISGSMVMGSHLAALQILLIALTSSLLAVVQF